jgi:hypothetical protein
MMHVSQLIDHLKQATNQWDSPPPCHRTIAGLLNATTISTDDGITHPVLLVVGVIVLD